MVGERQQVLAVAFSQKRKQLSRQLNERVRVDFSHLSRCTKLGDSGKKASDAALNWETQPVNCT
jgi:hypothetical protein